MALARVVLHVGPPRTGTTSIQGALAAGRRHLLKQGVYYPPTQPESVEGQPSLAWAVLIECGKPVAQSSQAYVSWDESLLGAEQAGAHTLLVSSEDFSSGAFDGPAFRQLRRRLGRLPVDIVFALRDPRTLVPSLWSHSVRWGIGCGEELLSLRDAVPLILRRRNVQVVDYLTALEDFLQPVRINLLTVPRKIDRRLLLSRFEEACRLPGGTIAGVPPAGDRTQHTSLENASLPLQRLLVLLSMNQTMASRHAARPGCSAESWSNSIAVRRCLLNLLRQEPCESLQPATLPAEYRPEAADLGRRIVRWVQARSAHVYGDLRDVWDENEAPGGQSGDGVAPLNEAEITRTAIRYWAETASELQNTITELERAREYWRDEASKWEELSRRVTNSWSWRLTKPLRLARFLQSILKLQHAREGS